VNDNYARCEIVKASSVLKMARDIECHIRSLSAFSDNKKRIDTGKVDTNEVSALAQELAKERGYPASLAKLR